MARTPRTFSRRGHAEAKAGENIGEGRLREDVTQKRNISARFVTWQTCLTHLLASRCLPDSSNSSAHSWQFLLAPSSICVCIRAKAEII